MKTLALFALLPALAFAEPQPPLAVELDEVGAQVMPTMVFYTTPAKGPAPLTVKITWKCTGAVGAVASGAWTGERPTAGTETIVVNEKGKYVLTCHGNTPDAQLTWTIPTTNTDGSTITNLAGFKIYVSTDSGAVPDASPITVANPTATTYTVESLPVGANYFAMKAYNTNGADSSITGTVSAELPATAIAMERWITITQYPPNPPTDISAHPPNPAAAEPDHEHD